MRAPTEKRQQRLQVCVSALSGLYEPAMAKAPAACAALGSLVLFSAVLVASMQMRTALPLWDLTPSELGLLARASWAAACASARNVFADGAAPAPGRLAAVLLQARHSAGSTQILPPGADACLGSASDHPSAVLLEHWLGNVPAWG